MKPRLWIPFAILVAAVAAAIFLADPAATPALSERPGSGAARVLTAPVETLSAARAVHLPGTTRAGRRAHLAFESSGRIVERRVDLGDAVRRGQVVARLDASPFELAVSAAAARLVEAEERLTQLQRDRQRSEELAADGAATREEVEQVTAGAAALTAARDAAKTALENARRAQRETVLTAPFDGVVSAVKASAGEQIGAGSPVVTLDGEGAVELRAEAPETLLPYFAAGQEVTVELPLQGRRVVGEVLSVGTAAGSSGLFPVRVDLPPGPGVLPGVTAELVVEAGDPQALSVPLASVIDPSGGRPALFRVRNEVAERVTLEVGGLVGDRVIVASAKPPLALADRVVVGGQGSLRDGDGVRPSEVAP
ncbi:MAG: efflux RND transporter periplasmic adaptor subunit [Acidobacteriota bacterium]